MPQDTRETDWIEWQGGECPVDPLAHVEVRFRDGDEHLGQHKADAYHWPHWGQDYSHPEGFWSGADIIAYRVVSK